MKRAVFLAATLVALLLPPAAVRAPAISGEEVRHAGDTTTTLVENAVPVARASSASAPVAAAIAGSTTTTTSIPIGPPTTTLDDGRDVTGGGRFHGGFGISGYDLWTFELLAPAVLVAETSDAADLCPGDTTMELFLDGNPVAFDDNSGPGRCSRLVQQLVTPGVYVLDVGGFQNAAVTSYYLQVEFEQPDCGNGIVERFEECDDGTGGADDCCLPDCTKAIDATPCSDGRLCNGEDTCLAGACVVHALNPCEGTDGDNNCSESCSDNGGGCQWPDPDGAPCSDGLFCNGADRCIAGTCQTHNGDPCRGPDGDGNCAESCKESSDSCAAADPGTPACDDGAWCNGNDTCFGGGCSVHTGNPCPGPDGDGDCSESCNENAELCNAADLAGSVCNDGLFCTGADKCAGGMCSTHAGSGCPGPDGDSNCTESCNEAAKNCLAADPANSSCSNGAFCDGADQCSAGICSIHAGNPCPGADGDGNCSESCNEVSDNCAAADANGSSCNDGVFCNGADTCSGGTCSVHAGNPCPGADGDGNCSESCNETTDTCTAADPNGAGCTDGLFCNGADTCSSGACTTHAGTPCPGADGDGNCAESCDETADNCLAADANGSACNDGVFCNGADSCSNGSCSVNAGNPCAGADGDGNCSESCSEANDNCLAADANGAACNDGVFCNGSDTCSNGSCNLNAGNPCPGADGDGNCAESCSEANDNCLATDANGTACNDGVFCNGSDSCSNGSCNLNTGNPCAGADGDGNCSESCSEANDNCLAADANGAACNDGVFCNGADTCAGGSCASHVGNPCVGPDGDGNCSESCDEGADNCLGADTNGAACNDSVFCNGADTCSGGTCSVNAGNPCAGADGDANCSESCSEAADACTAADLNGSACNDGVYCNGADSCAAGACGTHAGSPCPGPDGDGNCSETCNEAADDCSAADSNGSPCNDGLFCNGADSCSAGACSVHAGSPCIGADGDGNCSESCNEQSDTCLAADADGSSCNDGQFCNGADTCSGGACSVHAGTPCAGADGDGNCAESCSEAADACTAADPNGSPCNDALFCNGADTCAGGLCGAHGGDPCLWADGDGNCSESCNEAADNCSAADPNGSACTNGQFCDGTDTCSNGACSIRSGNPCPGADGDANCSETCNESVDACTGADPNGSACNDEVFCNGVDTCTGGACGTHAGNPCQGADADGDCSETCSEASDNCLGADADGSACNDGLFCNGSDTCTGGACIVHVGATCEGADGDGDCSESCSDSAVGCTGNDPAGSPCDDGIFCNGQDRCSNGSCSIHLGNPCAGPDNDANCVESCNEASDICDAPDANGSACNDGSFCNGADVCQGGACGTHAGNPCPGPDGDGNCSETCDETADACSGPDTNGASCNDAVFCNGADTCSNGACSVHAGNPCRGADGDANCSETCNEAGDTCTGADPNGSACDDGLYCNGDDSCISGVCSSHIGSPCTGADGDGDCSESCDESVDICNGPDANGSRCDDGLFCNGDDTCQSGACTGHVGSPCAGPDNDANCAESCSEAVDACIADDGNGAACNDGLFCNGGDSCQGGACSAHAGNPCVGADGDANCSESCSEGTDSCAGADPDGSDCDDGLFCNGGDSCLSGSCGAHVGDPCEGADGDANCSESCNEGGDSCVGADPNGSPCSDGLFCNGADTCAGGSCGSHAGSPCPGPDGDDNCAESCNEGAGACTSPDPSGAACSDGIFCNGSDGCGSGACTIHAGDPCPGADGDADCSETCGEAAQACTADDTNGSKCTDGNPCTVGDSCVAGACGSGVPSDCDDQNVCTTDACVAEEPFCSHEPLPNCPPTQLCGDLNDNGKVTASDSLAVLKAAVGGPECTALPCICNANGTGGVTSTDALLVLRYAVGSLATLSCPC